MPSPFYPNECFVCYTRSTLRRCGRCRLISYCGEEHQKRDWKSHKDFCSAICQFKKTKNLSHIYENLRDCSSQTWIIERQNMVFFTSSLLKRELEKHEIEMLRFPRSCIVCHDTRQNNLTNCSGCPLVSFCKQHPDTSHHDKICSDIKFSHDLETQFYKDLLPLAHAVSSIWNKIPKKNFKLPKSMSDYLDENLDPEFKVDPSTKLYASTYLCIPLTVLSALEKLENPSLSKMTIHIFEFHKKDVVSDCWEILLHLLPDLNYLTIVVTEFSDTLNKKFKLCLQCSLKKKQLIVKTYQNDYSDYMLKDEYETPNLIVFDKLVPKAKEDHGYNSWKELMNICSRLRCPKILTTDTEKRAKLLEDSLNSSFWKPLICFQGPNDFASMCFVRDWEEWEIAQICQYLIVVRAPKTCNEKEESTDKSQIKNTANSLTTPKKLTESVKQIKKDINGSFYAGICHVCKSSCASIPCKRCKMIFYCGSKHAKIHWPEHKEICKAIVSVLTELGTPHLFDNLQAADKESWKKTKIFFTLEIRFKLHRELLRFENQMFLFPRTCFVCHESDLSLLETCECGVSLCKVHREDSEHKILCKDFALEMKIRIYEIPILTTKVKVPFNKKETTLPPKMDCFINSYLFLKEDESSESFEKVLNSKHLSEPLTLLYALERSKYSVPKEMIVHIIGASDSIINDADYWKICLHWLNNLQSLKIIFIRNALPKQQNTFCKNSLNFDGMFSLEGRSFNFTTIKESYDQFFKSGDFSKPDVIIGYNLNLTNLNSVSAECPWSKTFSIIKQMNVPVVLTAPSENLARMESKSLETIWGKKNKIAIFEKNPYASLVPERDFSNERLVYANNFIIVSKNFKGSNEINQVGSTKSNCPTNLPKNANKVSLVKKKEFDIKKGGISQFESRTELNAQTIDETSDCTPEEDTKSEMIFKENLLLQEENKILKENLRFREENERLRKDNLKLKEELMSLKKENI